jgi:sugar lactone lactonase YvrE
VTHVLADIEVSPVGDVTAVLGEGPYWLPDESCLLWLDIPVGLLHRTRIPSGETETVELGEVSAVFPALGGGVLYAGGHRVAHRDESQSERTLAAVPARHDVRFNDGSVDMAGRVWVGSMHADEADPVGVLYRLEAGGVLVPVVSGVTISNGLGWSPDGSFMYYADSPTRRLDVFDYDQATGQIAGRRVFADLSGFEGVPDGLTVDADGYVWVAMFGGAALRRFAPSGGLDAVVPLPVSQPTSVAFGGPGMADLFVTTASRDLGPAERAAQPLAGRLLRLVPGPVGLPSTTTHAIIPS